MAAKMRLGELSPPRLRLLLCLFASEAHGQAALNPTQLSEKLSLSKNTISAHLRGLEEAGLVEREVDPHDLRRFRIRLAHAGRTWIHQSAPEHMRYLDGLIAPLSTHEIEQLQTLLGSLIGVLERHAQDGESRADVEAATSLRQNQEGVGP
jgi:DNA-binding MarR family transcriptional regulator